MSENAGREVWRNRIVEFRRVRAGDIVPHPQNWRGEDDPAQSREVRGNLEKYGQVAALVAYKREDGQLGMLDGHLRQGLDPDALMWVGITDLSESEAKAELAALDVLAKQKPQDDAALAALLQEVQATEGLGGTGFDETGLDALLKELAAQEKPPPVEDTGPGEPPPDPATKPGDVWLMGEHRLVCGDATTVEAMDACLSGASPKLCVTDPPYGVEYDPARRFVVSGKVAGGAQGKVNNDDRADWREVWAIAPADVLYCWHADVYSPLVADGIDACGFVRRALICWAKDVAPPLAYGVNAEQVSGLGLYHHQHEPCWYAIRDGASAEWVGDRAQTTLWNIPKPTQSETGHSTQKPLECMARPIRNHEGDVLDPFMGSGTTLIACEQLGRVCYGIEIEPRYVDVAVKRWMKATGRVATLEATGAPFPAGE